MEEAVLAAEDMVEPASDAELGSSVSEPVADSGAAVVALFFKMDLPGVAFLSYDALVVDGGDGI